MFLCHGNLCNFKKIFSFSFVNRHLGGDEPASGDRQLRAVHDPGTAVQPPAQSQVQDRGPGRTDPVGVVRGEHGLVVQVEGRGGDPVGPNGGMGEGRVQLHAGCLSVSGIEP